MGLFYPSQNDLVLYIAMLIGDHVCSSTDFAVSGKLIDFLEN